jgi:hypothetical protein
MIQKASVTCGTNHIYHDNLRRVRKVEAVRVRIFSFYSHLAALLPKTNFHDSAFVGSN